MKNLLPILLAPIVFSLIWVALLEGRAGQSTYDKALEEGRHQSLPKVDEFLKKVSRLRDQNDALWDPKSSRSKAIEALDFFAEIRAGELAAVALNHPSTRVASHAALSLREIRNPAHVPDLLLALKRSNVAIAGGTESQVVHQDFQRSLVSALMRLTEQDFRTINVDDAKQIRDVIEKCENWLKAQKEWEQRHKKEKSGQP